MSAFSPSGPIYIGWDARDALAAEVCASSLRRRTTRGVYTLWGVNGRPEYRIGEQRYDAQTDTPFSTDFSFGRFLAPYLARNIRGAEWALFTDPDTLWLRSADELFALAEERFAVMVVKHEHVPAEREKMGGLAQTTYPRKNWSSVCLWNLRHPANVHLLTQEPYLTWTGRKLHGFEWLRDEEIGALPPEWNWLAPARAGALPWRKEPAVVHWTQGGPWLRAYADAPYADAWRAECADFWWEGRRA